MFLIAPINVAKIKILENPELRIEIGLTYDLAGTYFLSSISLLANNFENIEIKELYRKFNENLKEDSRTIIIKSNNDEPFIVINNFHLANINNNSISINQTPFKIEVYVYNKNNDNQSIQSKLILEP